MGRSTRRTMQEDENESKQGQAWWGIAGLILVIAFIAISYVLSDPISGQTRTLVGNIDPQLWRGLVGFAIFILLLAVSSIIYAILAPKKKVMFSERELDKERKAIRVAEMAKRERQRQTRQQIAKARREGK